MSSRDMNHSKGEQAESSSSEEIPPTPELTADNGSTDVVSNLLLGFETPARRSRSPSRDAANLGQASGDLRGNGPNSISQWLSEVEDSTDASESSNEGEDPERSGEEEDDRSESGSSSETGTTTSPSEEEDDTSASESSDEMGGLTAQSEGEDNRSEPESSIGMGGSENPSDEGHNTVAMESNNENEGLAADNQEASTGPDTTTNSNALYNLLRYYSPPRVRRNSDENPMPTNSIELVDIYVDNGIHYPPFGRHMMTADLRLILRQYENRLDPGLYVNGNYQQIRQLSNIIHNILKLMEIGEDCAIDDWFMDKFIELITFDKDWFSIAQDHCNILKNDASLCNDANPHLAKLLVGTQELR